MLVTNGELRYIQRSRKGWSQVVAAAMVGISLYAQRKKEAQSDKVSDRRISRVERLLLLRRRSGWTIEELAVELECCPFWYRQLEKDGSAEVEELLCELTQDYQLTS